MIALLVILEAAISHSSIRIFTGAKEELLSRDLGAITEDMFLGGYSPELMDYCTAHMDDVSSDILEDPVFMEEYRRVLPALLERFGIDAYEDLDITAFPEFSS